MSKNKYTLINNNNTKTNKITKKDIKKATKKAINRIKNWSQYNEGLVSRGSFKRLAKFAIRAINKELRSKEWKKHSHPGSPKRYPDALILIIAVYREIFSLTFRDAEGFARDVFEEFGVEIPDYTTIERRMSKLQLSLKLDQRRLKGERYLMVDSTGYKVFGEGEWKVFKHGADGRRLWIKVHYVVDYISEQIVAFSVSIYTAGDNLEAPKLLHQAKTNLTRKGSKITIVLGDGAYNTKALKKIVEEEYGAELIAPPKIKPRSGGTQFIGANTKDNERCNEIGRDNWKKETGYHKRSLVETNMFRQKSSFGDRLRCRKIENQVAEIGLRVMIQNMWTNEWMPKYTKA